MMVSRGFGHQHFLHTTLRKIKRARQMIDRIKPGCGLEVDGGIDVTTAPLAVAAGADVLVAGSAIFNHRERVIAPRNGCGPQYGSNWEGRRAARDDRIGSVPSLWMLEPTAASGLGGRLLP